MSAPATKNDLQRLPPWIRVKVQVGQNRTDVLDLIEDLDLNTVCQSAKCPNIAECWHRRTATFMLLGNRCTRKCTFCAIDSFNPEPVDADEPGKVADAAARLGLKYVVVTSVNRDDLSDKGAGHFVATIEALRERIPDGGIEVLTPDFKGRRQLVEQVLAAKPTVFNHNMETCERLTGPVRSGGRYDRSLSVLTLAKQLAVPGQTATKSGIMVGLGETDTEVETVLRDLRAADVDILTIGQYLPPTREHWDLDRYVEPAQFEAWSEMAYELGFKAVRSAPMVRSSYHAEVMARQALGTDKEIRLH